MGTIGYKITFKDDENRAFDIYSDNTYNNECPPSTAEKKGCKAVVESLDFKNMIYNHCHVKAVVKITIGEAEKLPKVSELRELLKKYRYVDFSYYWDNIEVKIEQNLEIFTIHPTYSNKTADKSIKLEIDIYSPDKKLEQRAFNMVYTGRKLGLEIFLGTELGEKEDDLKKTIEILTKIAGGTEDKIEIGPSEINAAITELDHKLNGYSDLHDSIKAITKYYNAIKQAEEIVIKLKEIDAFLDNLEGKCKNKTYTNNIQSVKTGIEYYLSQQINSNFNVSFYNYKDNLEQISNDSSIKLEEEDKKKITEIIQYKAEYNWKDITTLSNFDYDKSYMKKYIDKRIENKDPNNDKDKETINDIKENLEKYKKTTINTIKDVCKTDKKEKEEVDNAIKMVEDAISKLKQIEADNHNNYQIYSELKEDLISLRAATKDKEIEIDVNYGDAEKAEQYLISIKQKKDDVIPSVKSFIDDKEEFGITNLKLVEQLRNLKYTDSKSSKELIQPYLVQVEETMYDFICRIANRCGEIVYYHDGTLYLGLKTNEEKKMVNTEDSSLISFYYEVAPKQLGNNRSFDEQDLYPIDISDTRDEYLEAYDKLGENVWTSLIEKNWNLSPLITFSGITKLLVSSISLADFLTKLGEDFLVEKALKERAAKAALMDKTNKGFDSQRDKAYEEQYRKYKGTKDNKEEVQEELVYFGTHKSNIPANEIFKNQKVNEKDIDNLNSLYFEFVKQAQDLWNKEFLVLEYNNSKYNDFSIGDEIVFEGTSYVVIYIERFFKSQWAGGTNDDTNDDTNGGTTSDETALKITAIPYFNKENQILIPPAIEKKKRNKSKSLGYGTVTDIFDPKKLGRVTFRYEWQEEGYGDDSPWINIVQPFASTETSGFKFTPQKGDKALIEYEDDDYERPFIAGFLYTDKSGINIKDSADAIRLNRTDLMPSRGITSACGHQIIFDDPISGNGETFFDSFMPILNTLKSYGDKGWNLFKFNDANKKISRFLAGGITMTDKLGFYTISASTNKRKINISSPVGDVSIDAFTGITISAPNGDVKIVGKNVSIEAGNKVNIKSGTNVDLAFRTAGQAILESVGKVFQKKLKLIDVSVLRYLFEIFVRPIGGSTTITSFTDLTLTAGRGSTSDPKEGSFGSAEKYVELKNMITAYMAGFPNDKQRSKFQSVDVSKFHDKIKETIKSKLGLDDGNANELYNKLLNGFSEKVTCENNNITFIAKCENLKVGDFQDLSDIKLTDEESQKLNNPQISEAEKQRITIKSTKLEAGKDGIINIINIIKGIIIYSFNANSINLKAREHVQQKNEILSHLKEEVKKEKIKLIPNGFDDQTKEFSRVKVLYDYIQSDTIKNQVGDLPFTIESSTKEYFDVDDIIKPKKSIVKMGLDAVLGSGKGGIWKTLTGVDWPDLSKSCTGYSIFNKNRWRPTGGITLSSDVATIATFNKDTGAFNNKQKTNISEDEMVKDFRTFLVQMAMGTKQPKTNLALGMDILKIT